MDPTLIGSLIALLQSAPYVGPFLPYIPLVCGVAAIIDMAVPPPPAGSAWVGLRSVIHVLALNMGNARNAVPAGAIPASVAAHVNEVRAVAAEVEIAAGTLAQVASGKPEAVPSPGVIVTGSKILAMALLASLGLTACTSAQMQEAIALGQLVCATPNGTMALVSPTGAAIMAQNSTKAYVDAACALVSGVAVSPPASGVAPSIRIAPPAIVLSAAGVEVL